MRFHRYCNRAMHLEARVLRYAIVPTIEKCRHATSVAVRVCAVTETRVIELIRENSAAVFAKTFIHACDIQLSIFSGFLRQPTYAFRIN